MKISRPVSNQNKRLHMQVVLLILKWEEKFKYKKSKENTAGRGLWGLKTARICFYFCLFIIRSVVVILVLLGFLGGFFGGGGVFYSLSVDIWQKRWLYHLRYIFFLKTIQIVLKISIEKVNERLNCTSVHAES